MIFAISRVSLGRGGEASGRRPPRIASVAARRLRQRVGIAVLALLACGPAAAPAAGGGCPGADPEALARYHGAVAWLADDLRGGRGAGTGGLDWAGEWLEERFAELALTPAGPAGWRQEVWARDPGDLPPAEVPRRPGFNVVGWVPAGLSAMGGAAQDGVSGVVVVAAHYDHLGFGGWLSEEPEVAAVHPGADDNASGVAALLEVGRCLAAGPAPGRRVLLAALTFEEVGRDGARALVEWLRASGTPVVAMIDLDMVGRLGDGSVEALAADSASGWPGLLAAACAEAGVDCAALPDDGWPSDHRPFLEAGIPALWLTTGRHADWHRPSDGVERIDVAGGLAVARLATALARALAERPERLAAEPLRPIRPSRTARETR